jgi:hypothetical protein
MPRAFVFSALLFAFVAGSVAGVPAMASTTLASLEAEIPSSPALKADELGIQAAADDVRATRDKTGLAFTYNNELGPEAVIVPYSVDDHVLRFEQAAGLKLPLGGTTIAQQLSILDAERREQIARIAMNEAYRERVAQLREAYVQYWTDEQQLNIEQAYFAVDERSQATALLKDGFWTQTDFLDYLNTVQSVRAQHDEDLNLASAQLAQIASAIGQSVEPFQPSEPSFYDGCNVDRAQALESAFAVDAGLAQLQAEQSQIGTELAKVPGSSTEESFETHAGTETDINHHVSGYALLAGVDIALPVRAGDEEHALRAQYSTQLQAVVLQQAQRRVELTASVDAALADLASEKAAFNQALAEEDARKHDLATAITRVNTIKQAPQAGFADVHAKTDDFYVSRRAAVADQNALLLEANNLLMIAPGACGGHYEAIPPFDRPATGARRKNKALPPSQQNR